MRRNFLIPWKLFLWFCILFIRKGSDWSSSFLGYYFNYFSICAEPKNTKLAHIAFESLGYWIGPQTPNFFFGPNYFFKEPHYSFVQIHLAQISQNRVLNKSRTRFDKNPTGPLSLWKPWLLDWYKTPNFFFWLFWLCTPVPTRFYREPKGPDRFF